MAVKLYKWNPRRPVLSGRLGRLVPIRRRVNNFGDLLGPLIVKKLLVAGGVSRWTDSSETTLMSVGSVLHLAPPRAVVWGTGINGKMPLGAEQVRTLDIRAVRGPRTRERLGALGVRVPKVYGDPALLIPMLWDAEALIEGAFPGRPIYVPNFNDARQRVQLPQGVRLLSPTDRLSTVLREIAGAELVIGSSLHALIIAEALGIPARGVISDAESPFKYDDYYFGTGRYHYRMAENVPQALRMGGERPPRWDAGPLLEAFPWDLWDGGCRVHVVNEPVEAGPSVGEEES